MKIDFRPKNWTGTKKISLQNVWIKLLICVPENFGPKIELYHKNWSKHFGFILWDFSQTSYGLKLYHFHNHFVNLQSKIILAWLPAERSETTDRSLSRSSSRWYGTECTMLLQYINKHYNKTRPSQEATPCLAPLLRMYANVKATILWRYKHRVLSGPTACIIRCLLWPYYKMSSRKLISFHSINLMRTKKWFKLCFGLTCVGTSEKVALKWISSRPSAERS